MQVDEPIKSEAGPSEPIISTTTNGTTEEEEVKEEGEGGEGGEDVEMVDTLPEDASEVIYVNNLNEKIKIDGELSIPCFLITLLTADILMLSLVVLIVLKQSLRTLFRQYGNVLGVVAHRSLRMRGQAFITMTSKDAAVKAVKEVKGFPLYGKPMVSSYFIYISLKAARLL